MRKFFFPLSGVGFSDLRQIALTFCHNSVIDPATKNKPANPARRRSFGA
jgi:hypothetical protein